MASDAKGASEKHVLRSGMGGGPHGLGDPDDQSLRKVEKEVLIPMKMKEKAKNEKCTVEVREFGECAKEQGVLLPFMCRKVAKNLEKCLSSWYQNAEFVEMCTNEYLAERSEYRRTGIKQKMKKKDAVIG